MLSVELEAELGDKVELSFEEVDVFLGDLIEGSAELSRACGRRIQPAAAGNLITCVLVRGPYVIDRLSSCQPIRQDLSH